MIGVIFVQRHQSDDDHAVSIVELSARRRGGHITGTTERHPRWRERSTPPTTGQPSPDVERFTCSISTGRATSSFTHQVKGWCSDSRRHLPGSTPNNQDVFSRTASEKVKQAVRGPVVRLLLTRANIDQAVRDLRRGGDVLRRERHVVHRPWHHYLQAVERSWSDPNRQGQVPRATASQDSIDRRDLLGGCDPRSIDINQTDRECY